MNKVIILLLVLVLLCGCTPGPVTETGESSSTTGSSATSSSATTTSSTSTESVTTTTTTTTTTRKKTTTTTTENIASIVQSAVDEAVSSALDELTTTTAPIIYTTTAKKTTPRTTSTTTIIPIRLSIADFVEEIRNDLSGTQKKYKGQYIEITAKLIEEPNNSGVYVFADPTTSDFCVGYETRKNHGWQVGKTYTLVGKYSRATNNLLILEDPS